jgi:hypothetical protein
LAATPNEKDHDFVFSEFRKLKQAVISVDDSVRILRVEEPHRWPLLNDGIAAMHSLFFCRLDSDRGPKPNWQPN